MTHSIEALPFDSLHLHRDPFIYEKQGSWSWDSPERGHYNLWICTEGAAQMRCGETDYPVQPWTVFVFPPEMAVRGRIEEESGALTNFSAHWTPITSAGAGQIPFFTLTIREVDTVQALIQALIRLSVFHDPLSRQQEAWVLLELLGLLWRERQTPNTSHADTMIYRQIERMRSGRHLFESVESLAVEAGLSRVHYTRHFRRITGDSPNYFLIKQRVERACILLRETNWTIGTIAETVGYADVYFFSRQFRRVLGKSPGQFRSR